MLQSLSCGERDPAPLQSERPVGKAGKQAFDPTADREHSKGEMAPAANAGAMLQKRNRCLQLKEVFGKFSESYDNLRRRTEQKKYAIHAKNI